MTQATPSVSLRKRLIELAALFFKIGIIGFGGPAAHIALMELEIVRKRRWVTQQQFLDMLGAANLIPGPSSTEMAITTGFVRAGWPGLCVAGACFITPAAIITGAFAWAYVQFGSFPQTASVLGGVKPAVIALIAIAIFNLGKTALKDAGLVVLGLAALAAFLLGISPILILLGGGLVGMAVRQISTSRASFNVLLAARSGGKIWQLQFLGTAALAATIVSKRPSYLQITVFFLKIGAVIYGGGYVLLAFLEHGLVQQHAWLTKQQLLDAIAIGQFTPGPVFSTATFIGYLLGGVPGAALATVGIFLPSFFYVALLGPVLFRLRESASIAVFLDSVNACAVALMMGVTWRLTADAIRGWSSFLIAAGALILLLRWKVNSGWIVLGGGVAGLLFAEMR